MPVVLLCHCDGPNGSSINFVDSSPSAHTLTAGGGAVISTANPKFGSGAASFLNSIDYINVGGAASDFNLGAGQFTIEAWGYHAATPSATNAIASQFGGSSNLGWFFGFVGGALAFYYSTTGTDNPNVGAAYSPTLNTWIHYAVDRDASNVLRVYANGVVIASATVASTIFASTQSCYIGNDHNSTRSVAGYLDEVRITTSLAQYGGAFTPPTAPFGGIAPPTGPAYALTASRAGIPSAMLWQTTTRTFALPLSTIVAEAPAPPPSGGGGGAQARTMILA